VLDSSRSHRLDFTFLQCAQELGLHRQGELSNLIEQEGLYGSRK
jgi:hypothetical protein